ncbi:MAG: DUF1304 domain-containing protein [Micromonosporaceae bacterium]
MTALVMTAAAVAALIHVLFFLVESVWFMRPVVYARFVRSREEAEVLRPMAYNQGFYNLFLAVGSGGGVLALALDEPVVGNTLVAFTCGSMVLAGVVLWFTDRRFVRGSLLQAVPAIVAVAAVAATAS